MKTLVCFAVVFTALLASMMFWMSELVSRGLIISTVSTTRYFFAGIVMGMIAALFLRAAVERE